MQRIVNASVAEISGRLRSNVNDQVRHELSAALDAADQSVADVDALLSERAAFDAALEAATQRTIESLCSDVALRTQAMLQSQEHESPQLGVADVVRRSCKQRTCRTRCSPKGTVWLRWPLHVHAVRSRPCRVVQQIGSGPRCRDSTRRTRSARQAPAVHRGVRASAAVGASTSDEAGKEGHEQERFRELRSPVSSHEMSSLLPRCIEAHGVLCGACSKWSKASLRDSRPSWRAFGLRRSRRFRNGQPNTRKRCPLESRNSRLRRMR